MEAHKIKGNCYIFAGIFRVYIQIDKEIYLDVWLVAVICSISGTPGVLQVTGYCCAGQRGNCKPTSKQ